jgi:hypothetical protein
MWSIVFGLRADSPIGNAFRLCEHKPITCRLHEEERTDFHPLYFGIIRCSFDIFSPQPKAGDNIYARDDYPPGYGPAAVKLPSDI